MPSTEPYAVRSPAKRINSFFPKSAAAELHDRLDPVAVLQEANRVVLLKVVIVVVGVGAELQFLHQHDVLLLLGVVLLLLLVVLIMAEVDGLGHGRHRRGRNQHQIETQFLGLAQGRRGWHDLARAVRKHRAHFAGADELIHIFSAVLPARGEISWIHSLWVIKRLLANGRSRSRALEIA